MNGHPQSFVLLRKVKKEQDFPFRKEQGAKIETGGHLLGKKFSNEVGGMIAGISSGFKIPTSHIEAKIDTFATEVKPTSNPKLTKITSANSHG